MNQFRFGREETTSFDLHNSVRSTRQILYPAISPVSPMTFRKYSIFRRNAPQMFASHFGTSCHGHSSYSAN